MADQRNPKAAANQRGAISPLTIRRLSLYLRFLDSLAWEGITTVSSRQLSDALGLTAAQVRKDLAQFALGRPGIGYKVADLMDKLRGIFGTDKLRDVVLVGAGSLGQALMGYRGFGPKGFRVRAAFDSSPANVGRKITGLTIQPMKELSRTIRSADIRLAVVAVPVDAAQEVTDRLCKAGIKGILNFAPVRLDVPPDVSVITVDLAVQLQQLNYFVSSGRVARHRG